MTSQVQELLDGVKAGRWLLPSAELPNPVSLARAISGICGGRYDWNDPVADQLRSAIGEPKHLVFVIADGFGMNFVNMLPETSFIRQNLAVVGRAAFPSITGANLFALSRGEWPGQHGVIGWFMHLAEINERATVFPWIRTRDGKDLSELGVTPEAIYPGDSLVSGLSRDSTTLVPEELALSNPSRGLHGSTTLGYRYRAEAVDQAILRASQAEPSYTHIYWPPIDKAAHTVGTHHEDTLARVTELENEMKRLSENLSDESRLVLIADHGHLNIREDEKFLVSYEDPLRRLMSKDATGDTKTAIIHVQEGKQDDFAREFRNRFAEHFFLLSAEDIADLELLGPDGITELTSDRLGDFIVVSKGQSAIKFLTPENTRPIAQVSEHGGFTPDEMIVPIVIA